MYITYYMYMYIYIVHVVLTFFFISPIVLSVPLSFFSSPSVSHPLLHFSFSFPLSLSFLSPPIASSFFLLSFLPPDNGLEAGDEEPDLMSDEEDEEDAQICGKDDHTWVNERCLICLYCKYCTGYGPSCCNEGMPDRDPGK